MATTKKKPSPAQLKARAKFTAMAKARAKAAKGKKITGSRHTDTKSHNVRINVLSGFKLIGALLVGFKGKLYGWPFSIKAQYKIDGSIAAQIWDNNGVLVELTGLKKTEIPTAENAILQEISNLNDDKRLFENKDVVRNIKKFVANIYDEASKENKKSSLKATTRAKAATRAKATTRAKTTTRVKAATKDKNYQTGKSNLIYDKMKKALPPGKRKSSSGRTYYERRVNRSDKPGQMAGNTIFEYKVSHGGKYYVTSNIPMHGMGITKIGDGTDHKRNLPTYLFTERALKKMQKTLGKENTTYIQSDY